MSELSARRTVVITGGSKGIGASLARAFHANGDCVVLVSRSDSGLTAELRAGAHFVSADVRQPAELHAAAGAARDLTGRIDVWINNAGYSRWKSLSQIDEAVWDDLLDTNLKGVLFGCQAAAAHLPSDGCIINVSSLAGKRGSANNAMYCASKFGVTGITQALAKELGPRGIRVNAVCPVLVPTEGLLEALQEPEAPSFGQDTARYLHDFARSQSALGRLPTREEVATVCIFLASPAASAITGQSINVDCGVFPQ